MAQQRGSLQPTLAGQTLRVPPSPRPGVLAPLRPATPQQALAPHLPPRRRRRDEQPSAVRREPQAHGTGRPPGTRGGGEQLPTLPRGTKGKNGGRQSPREREPWRSRLLLVAPRGRTLGKRGPGEVGRRATSTGGGRLAVSELGVPAEPWASLAAAEAPLAAGAVRGPAAEVRWRPASPGGQAPARAPRVPVGGAQQCVWSRLSPTGRGLCPLVSGAVGSGVCLRTGSNMGKQVRCGHRRPWSHVHLVHLDELLFSYANKQNPSCAPPGKA